MSLLADVGSRREARGRGRLSHRAGIEDALARLAAAAEQSQLVLFAVASVVLKDLLDAQQVRIIIHSGGSWHRWDELETGDGSARMMEDLPQASAAWDAIVPLENCIFVPVKVGSVAFILEGVMGDGELASLIGTAATILRLALASCEGTHGNPDKLEAIEVFQRVAGRILKSQDLQEVLLLITHEAKSRLSADICGILLREGDTISMRRCVGNLAAATAALRMCQGQGVAGRVFQTRQPCSVEDYVRSDIISRDFFDLARTERVRSALAAPLISQNEVIGVLEVWRRNPSTFTRQHTAELVTLANLASIAIENVRLSEAREAVVRELGEANCALRTRYEVIRKSAALQEDLTRTLLEGQDLPGIAEQAHKHIGAPIAFLDPQLKVEQACPAHKFTLEILRHMKMLIQRGMSADTRLTVRSWGHATIAFQPITAGVDRFGWVVLVANDEPDESLQIAVTQVCITAALLHVKKRAAARARSDKLVSVFWDLLDAPDHIRQLAIERARDLDVPLVGNQYVLCCIVEGLEQADSGANCTAAEVERRRRFINEAIMQIPGAGSIVRLAALRGDMLCILCADRPVDTLKQFAVQLTRHVVGLVPQLSLHVGFSAPSPDPATLNDAYREARIAAAVARQSGKIGGVVYADAGVAGLLMGARDDADFRKFVLKTLGPILAMKTSRRDILLSTLRTFFAVNCSRQLTAKRLRIHQKTLIYRLATIARLTGLDFSRHEDRVVVDLALRMHQIIG
jgi:sugar diacid utilization regulator/GAF domain-containing protein